VKPAPYALNRFLTALARRHEMREAVADVELAGQDLDDAEKAALRAGDTGALHALGANPYLIRRVFRPRFRF
jgi:hypothetical protein